MNKKHLFTTLLLVFSVIASACTPTEVEKIVEVIEEVEVTREVEVEVIKEVDVETIVEVEVMAEEGRIIRFGASQLPQETTDLDAIRVASGLSIQYISLIFDRLGELDPQTFEITPLLAESWEKNDDASEWTFHLRDDVTWHDGSPFVAQDVVWTFERIKTHEESEAMVALANLNEIIADDEHTARFVFSDSTPEALLLLVSKNTWIVKNGVDSDTLRASPNTTVGTGAFMLGPDFDPQGTANTMVANPNYFLPDLPKMDGIEFHHIIEASTRLGALFAGALDGAEGIERSALPEIESNPDTTAFIGPAVGPWTIDLWTDTPPFDDNRVLQALKLVIDRQAILDVALLGAGGIGDDTPVNPVHPCAWRAAADVPGPDVEAAIALLTEAGYGPGNPLAFELNATIYPGVDTMLEIFQANALEAGVEIELLYHPEAEFWDSVWMHQPAAWSGWNGRPPWLAFFVPLGGEEISQYNDTHWFPDEFADLMTQSAIEVDDDARCDLFKQTGQLLAETGGFIAPVFPASADAYSSKCTGWEQGANIPEIELRWFECTS